MESVLLVLGEEECPGKARGHKVSSPMVQGKNDANRNEEITEIEKDLPSDVCNSLPSGALQVNVVQF